MRPVFTLVPSATFTEESARQMLSELAPVGASPLSSDLVNLYDAVLVYTGERPAVYDLMMSTCKISGYNKIIAKVEDGLLSLVIAEGQFLKFCNCFEAPDFTTAEYYIFMVLKKFQINPEISSIYFTNSLLPEEAQSLLSYFKNVEVLK